MRRDWILPLGFAGVGLLLYGAIVETEQLVGEKKTLRLPNWPKSHNGYKVGFIADLHLRGAQELALTETALEWLLKQNCDAIAIAGDILPWWREDSIEFATYGLRLLADFPANVVIVPGNHDYYGGDASWLRPLIEGYGAHYLQNQMVEIGGVQWVGIDSANESQHDPDLAMKMLDPSKPSITLWHEGDFVDELPSGTQLMLSGHSHGGQFTTPWGWAPMTVRGGSKYLRGFYPDAPTPLYVTRGLATTGPPSRLFCRPEVSVLTLVGN